MTGCQSAPIPTIQSLPTKTPGPSIFYVNKSTGLYEAPEIDAKMIETLSEGAMVIHTDGAESLSCTSFSDSGTTYNLCLVEVLQSGKTGWILRKWINSVQ